MNPIAPLLLASGFCLLLTCGGTSAADAPADWQSLFNQKDLSNWDKWLGPKSSGYLDPKTTTEPPLGLTNDPLRVFTVAQEDGGPASPVAGHDFGAIATKAELARA